MRQHITPNITHESLDDGRIHFYSVLAVTPLDLSSWDEAIYQTLESWPDQTPFLAVYDLSAPGVGIPFLLANQYDIQHIGVSSDQRDAIELLIERRTNLEICIAMLLSPTISGKIANNSRRDSSLMRSNVQFKTFFDTEVALNWLRGFALMSPGG